MGMFDSARPYHQRTPPPRRSRPGLHRVLAAVAGIVALWWRCWRDFRCGGVAHAW